MGETRILDQWKPEEEEEEDENGEAEGGKGKKLHPKSALMLGFLS